MASTMLAQMATVAMSRRFAPIFSSPLPSSAVIGSFLPNFTSHCAIERIAAHAHDGRDVEQRDERAERERDGERAHPLPPLTLPFLVRVAVHDKRHRCRPQANHCVARCSASITANNRKR